MRYLDLTLPALEENLALDEALLLEAEGGEILRVWESPTFAVILGAGCRLAEDVDESACREDSVSILRRASGGGTVLLGPGCLLFTLVMSMERAPELAQVRSSYAYILERIRASLLDLEPRIELAGTSDLAIGGKKFSGNAQQRKRTHLLHHGTLLYGFPVEQVGRYLRLPARQPDYRRNRAHESFLTSLEANVTELKSRLQCAWQTAKSVTAYPSAEVRRLVEEKYRRPDWIRRR